VANRADLAPHRHIADPVHGWFDMHYLCACEQYLRLANGLVQWLLTGDDWRRDTTMQFSK